MAPKTDAIRNRNLSKLPSSILTGGHVEARNM